MPNLTKSFIDKVEPPPLKPDGKPTQVFYRDDTLKGFALRVWSGGTKTFILEKRIDGRVRRMTIAKYGELTPAQARAKAQELLGEIAKGNDPAEEKRIRKSRNITLIEAFEDYLNTRKDLKSGTINNYRKCMNGCFSDWHRKRIADISKSMVQERHSDIGGRAPARANNAMRVLRAVFNHVIAKHNGDSAKPIVETNPVDGISQTRGWYRVDRRQSLLEPHELKPWYEATNQLAYDVTRDYLHLILFTGLRKTEAATLKWENISFEANTLTVPDTKNREPHTLPLTTHLQSLLKHRHQQSESEWVFPSPRTDTHLSEPRSAFRYIEQETGKNTTLHDLRRTFITIAESLDIPAYALKRLMNHRDPNDVTAGYIVSSVDRLREPMEKISKFILEKVENE
ncbi:integrase family protein [Bacterioplanoides sp. SCSIO 12839]|uniref:tyrosine-type recombinase/integrase n=1 Tax=Bacterioplanoides sp. SCSIO 12839 TaxID=2829569 RepID=UPI002105CBE5|nr:integrase family protein [Bacterioplanoides sp. SCSIO 12839]UTW46762.1 integrase family protein [Bacterioplanoides sp. SCSIO 12839]